jgi:TfoX/Sxy family transcriptional regulator of competence genes
MAISESYARYVLEQLISVGDISANSMCGGVGMYVCITKTCSLR